MKTLLNTPQTLALIVIALFTNFQVSAQILSGTRAYTGTPGFDRGYQATTYCGNNPEAWVRGSAFLDKQTGLLTMHIDLETDATHAGPVGQVLVYIFDYYGNLITRVASSAVGRGGKFPGSAARTSVQASFYLGPQVGQRAARMTVVANYLGAENRWFNISLDQIKDAAGFIQQFGMFFF